MTGVKQHLGGKFDFYPTASAFRQMGVDNNAHRIEQKRIAAGISRRRA